MHPYGHDAESTVEYHRDIISMMPGLFLGPDFVVPDSPSDGHHDDGNE